MKYRNKYVRRFDTRKLTFEQAESIRKRYAEGDSTQRELAETYKVSQSVIHSIVTKRSYLHDDPKRNY